jgi:CheY-like chemotaxis protein
VKSATSPADADTARTGLACGGRDKVAGRKVLVVDDSREIRELFTTGLSLEGFSVTVAANGFAALRMAPGQDAIVTDIDMPDMTGVELIERVRATRGDTFPIVVVTGLCGEEMRKRPPPGSCAILDKPCDPMAVADVLRGLLFSGE